MAYDTSKLTKLSQLQALAQKVKSNYATKEELSSVSTDATAAIKSVNVSGNTISFYTSADKTGTAIATVDFPKEMFLDQSKTEFVAKFKWSDATYPGSTNPSLDGKPVMVLAVKGTEGTEETISYSFLSMSALVDTYVAKDSGKDASTTVEISDYTVEVKVNISATSDNQLQLKDDGLYVPVPQAVDISGKVDKVSGTKDDIVIFGSNGAIADSGKKLSDYVSAVSGKGLSTNDYTTTEKDKLSGIADNATKVEASSTNGNIKINGTETTVYTEPSNVVHGDIATDAEVTEMLNEVFAAS
jgi:hypothetical protein